LKAEPRIACILLPDFPLELFFKTRPTLRETPVALAETAGDTAEIIACNEPAARCDITVGVTVARANSYCPDLTVGIRDMAREQQIIERLYRTLQQVGPLVEPTGTPLFFLEAAGLHRLYRDEPGIARKIRTVLRPFGYPVKLGFAANKFVARTAAQQADCRTPVIVPSGAEAVWLDCLQVDNLTLSENAKETLYDLGIATVGQMAALPANEVVQRFGHEGVALARRARGHDPVLFVAEHSDEILREQVTLDYPLHRTAPILARIEPLLDRLTTGLRRRGRASREIRVALTLDNCTECVFKIATEKPTVTPAAYLRQLRSDLERRRLDSGVTGIAVIIPYTATLLLEQTSFEQAGALHPLDRDTCDTIDRTLDGARLCTVSLQPSHLPEQSFRLSPVTVSTRRTNASSGVAFDSNRPYSLHRIAGLRLVQPPRPTEIRFEPTPLENRIDADTVPKAHRYSRSDQTPSDNHRGGFMRDNGTLRSVVRQCGPWKLSGEWWGGGDSGFDRLYYELQTEDHCQYLVYFDRGRPGWFLQGVYD